MNPKVVLAISLVSVFVLLLASALTQVTGYASLVENMNSQSTALAGVELNKSALYVPLFSLLTYLLFFVLVMVFILLVVLIKERKQ